MLDKGRINSIQLLLLLVMAELATSLFTVPSRAIMAAGPDSWISLLVVTGLYGLLVAWVTLTLSQRFPTRVFTEYLPDIVGRVPGKILTAIFAILLMHISGGILSQGSAFVHIAFLRETPSLLLDMVFMGAAFYGAYLGIEVIARHTVLLFAFFTVSVLVVVLLVLPDVNIDNFLPVLENGYMPVILGAKDASAWRGEVFLILMFYPYLNLKQEASKAAYGTIIIAVVFSTLITMTVIGVFGSEVASTQLYTVFKLARYISIAQFIERIDILIVIIWIAGVILKLAIFQHAAGIAAATTLGVKNYRWPLLGSAIISTAMALIFFGNQAQFDYFFDKIWPLYAYSIELFFPALILILALLLNKKGVNES